MAGLSWWISSRTSSHKLWNAPCHWWQNDPTAASDMGAACSGWGVVPRKSERLHSSYFLSPPNGLYPNYSERSYYRNFRCVSHYFFRLTLDPASCTMMVLIYGVLLANSLQGALWQEIQKRERQVGKDYGPKKTLLWKTHKEMHAAFTSKANELSVNEGNRATARTLGISESMVRCWRRQWEEVSDKQDMFRKKTAGKK